MSDDRKRSWKEIDQARDGTRRDDTRPPRNRHEQARQEQATQTYLKEADKLFSSTGLSEEAEAQEKRLRDSHGTSEMAEACRAFRDELGMPSDLALLSIFLDSNEPDLVVEALETILTLLNAGAVELSKGDQSHVRVLSQDFNNDIAEVAEDILAKLE